MTAAIQPRLEHIAPDHLHPSPYNPRKTFDASAIDELAASMRESGQFTPLLVRPHPKKGAGHYEIGAGETRWLAGTKLKLSVLRCEVQERDDASFAKLVVWENIHRRNLRALEEADGYRTLMTVAKLTVEEIAKGQEVSPDYVRDRLRLFKLTPDAKSLLEARRIELGHALELAKLQPAQQAKVMKEALFRGHSLVARSQVLDLKTTRNEEQSPVSVAELKAWIDERIFADVAHPELEHLFPSTAKLLEHAKVEKLPQVFIGTGYIRPEVKGKHEVLTPANWRRADGLEKSKPCDRPKKVGVIAAADAARGQAFLICTSKACAVHFPEHVKRAAQKAKGEAKAVAKGKAPLSFAEQEKRRRDAEEKERAARKSRCARLAAVLPAVTARIVAVVSALNPSACLDAMDTRAPKGSARARLLAQVPAKDLAGGVRRLYLAAALSEYHAALDPTNEYWFERSLTALCKELGIKLERLLVDASPTKHLKCAHCGCTEAQACKGGCAWVTTDPPVCSNPKCVKAQAAATAPKAASPAKQVATKKAASKRVSVKAPAAKKTVAKRNPVREAFMAPVQPDAVLATVVGAQPMPRTELTKNLWAYIKQHGLQDKKNRRMINADETLKALFGGKPQVSIFDLTKLARKHSTPVPTAKGAR